MWYVIIIKLHINITQVLPCIYTKHIRYCCKAYSGRIVDWSIPSF